jgi:LysM repeat protein
MQSLRQVGGGLLLGIFSIVTVVGAISLALAEGNAIPTVVPSATSVPPTSVPVATLQLSTEIPAPSPTATILVATPPEPITCQPPVGWFAIAVQPGETLESLAAIHRTTVEQLKSSNCLVSDELVSGTILYMPPNPTATLIPCGPPAGWINYIVIPGDTLYRISQLYRVSITQLQAANCLGYVSMIKSGQVLKVPNVATSTPATTATWTATLNPTDTATITATATENPVTVTSEPSATNTNIPPSATPEAPTNTPVPAASDAAPAPSATPTQ